DVARQSLATNVALDSEIVFMTRDSSSVAKSLMEFARAAADALGRMGWSGTAFTATVETIRRRRRQILRHQLTAVLSSAIRLDGSSGGQRELFAVPSG